MVNNNTNLSIEDSETSIVNNTGLGPPVHVVSSHCNINQVIFAGNRASEYNASIHMFNSTMDLYNVHFLKPPLESSTILSTRSFVREGIVGQDDCDIYVSVHVYDSMYKASCFVYDRTNQSFPVIDMSATCPTPTPTPVVVTTVVTSSTPVTSFIGSSSANCFSSNNMVQIFNGSYVPIHQLFIGDYVESGDGQYTQIYGFGHLDHKKEGQFFHISFHNSYVTRDTLLSSPPSFMELSAAHLIRIERNHQQCYIQAKDVVKGDVLFNGFHDPVIVDEIEIVLRQGVYAPLTYSGHIVVNGIVSSNYVHIRHFDSLFLDVLVSTGWNAHTIGHFLFTPQRIFCSYYMNMCQQEIYWNGYGLFTYGMVMIHQIISYFF
jgi:Hint module